MENDIASAKIGFQIKAIEILEFSLFSQSQPITDIFTYHTNLSLEHRISEQNKVIIVLPTAEIIHEDKKTILAKIRVSFVYEFNSFEGFTTGSPAVYNFPKESMVALNSISISTLRGIMFSLFRGTFLHKAILPVVDPKSFTLEEIPK
jgi:hypothetical protein